MMAVIYVLIRSVGGKFQVAFPSPAGTGFGVGELETTSQWSGAVTVKVKIDFRSGCSNAAYTRRASGTSNCEYKYTRSSAGSTKRCSPSPVREYGSRAVTMSSFDSARPVSSIRESTYTSRGSNSAPLNEICRSCASTRSTNVEAPCGAENRTVVEERKWDSPTVRSRATSYEVAATVAERVAASSRVRFMPGMNLSCHEFAPRAWSVPTCADTTDEIARVSARSEER